MLVFSVGRSPSWGRVVFVFICGWFLALCMVVTLLPAKALAVVLSAWGGIPPLNVNGVYQIYTADQLYWFAAQVNGGNGKIYGKLVADIVVSENVLNEDGSLNGDGNLFRPREPIGNVINPYYSTFDGNNKTISGLYYHSDKFVRDVGLFGNIAGTAKVKNLGLVDSYIDGASSTGGVVGFSSGYVQQCYNEATIIGDYKVGGVVGYNYGTVKNGYNTGNVIGSYTSIGGVVGQVDQGTVQYCYNTGFVSGSNYFGAIIGLYSEPDIEDDGPIIVVSSQENHEKNTRANSCAVSNCFYLSEPTYGGNKYGTAMSQQQFASGEVAYLLGAAFGQTLGTDIYPVLSGMKVFKNQIGGCVESTYEYVYSNIQASAVVSHNWVDATCTARQTCFDCGLMVGQMRPHEFGQTIVHKPAPGVVGYSVHTCTVCGYREEFDFVELTGMTVSGLIKSFILDSEVTVELLCDGEVKYRTVIFGSNVYYTIENVQPGAYTLRISKDKHVTREYEFVVGQEDVTLNAKICHLGDVTGDGSCNVKDYQRLLRHVNKTDPLN